MHPKFTTPLLALLMLSVGLAGCAGGDVPAAEDSQLEDGVANVTTEPTPEAGVVRGSVTDDEALPLGGVEVGIVELDSSTTTPGNGSFEFRGVPVGTYRLVANKLGYESVASMVTVTAGQVAEVTVKLAPIAIRDPYPLSLNHVARHEVGEKWATWALSLAEMDPCMGCTWTDTPPEGSTHMLIEIFGAHSTANPQGDKEWYWLFSEGNGNGSLIVQGEFELPIRIELEADDYEGTTNFWSQLLCEEQWFCLQEQRDVWITFFYDYEEIPEGFTAGPELETS